VLFHLVEGPRVRAHLGLRTAIDEVIAIVKLYSDKSVVNLVRASRRDVALLVLMMIVFTGKLEGEYHALQGGRELLFGCSRPRHAMVAALAVRDCAIVPWSH